MQKSSGRRFTDWARIGLGTVLLWAAPAPAASPPPRIPSLAWTPRSDWMDVQTNGVAGDGRTDDTAALQAVLNRAKEGVVFYFPPGTYRITRTLTMTGPATGVGWIGHGRDTRLVWDGETGGRMFKEDGFAHGVRYEGFEFDGQGKAAIGFWHFSDHRFETEILHRNMAFRRFTQAGIYCEPQPNDKYATAEIVFENCLFEDCAVGVSSTSFNDYDYTYDGCEFRACGVGVRSIHGNFYIRNTHFENSRELDIDSAGEHGCSIRRVTSWGSKQFLSFRSSVGSMVIEDCKVGGWTDKEGAMVLSGAPTLMFDCEFSHPPGSNAPVRLASPEQRLLVSESAVAGGGAVLGGHTNHVRLVPKGRRSGNIRSPRTSFLRQSWAAMGPVFDARRDFGAKGDCKADDTEAVQKTIDAARAQGGNAVAYLPRGDYKITRTLRIEGRDYAVAGSGLSSRLHWTGEPDGITVAVRDPENVRIEYLMIGHDADVSMSNAVDVLHTATGSSSMTYETLYVYGMYKRQPFARGLRFRDLDDQATVLIKGVNGNLRFTDCARARILASVSYEGSLVVEGKDTRRGGLLGFQTRLATVVARGLYLRDNQSIVMSDFYSEQSDNGYLMEGGPAMPPGRATIQGPKFHMFGEKPRCLDIRDYAGEIFFGPVQFYCDPKPAPVVGQGTSALTLGVLACPFYNTQPDWRLGPNVRLILAGNQHMGLTPNGKTVQNAGHGALTDNANADDLRTLSAALDDLRRLGELDLALNHPECVGR